MGFGQGGSCRCLQNKEGGGRLEASLGPGVSAVPERLVWARPCPWVGHRRCPCCKRSRPAGKLEGGAHLVRRHLGAPLKARSTGSAHLQPLSAPSQAAHRLSPQRRHRGAMKAICHHKARHRFSAKPSPGLSQETAYKIPTNDLTAYFPM